MNNTDYDMSGYSLHVIKTCKFKTITVDVSFRRKVCGEDITIRNLLKEMMLDASYNYPTERDLVIETENLYDLKLLASSHRIGNDSILSFKCRFLNEKYTENGMNKDSVKFLLDIIFNPLFGNNIDKCKEKIKKSILSLKDNKIKYSLYKLLESTKDKVYSYCEYGNIDDLNKITIDDIKIYYDSILSNDLIDIFVVGDVNPDDVKNIFKEYFKVSTYHKKNFDILVEELTPVKKVIELREKDKVNQTQFTMLCDIHNINDFERKYVLPVFNEFLGGSANSVLFENIREKNSMAYYVNSIVKGYDNIVMLYAGIDKNNIDNIYKLIRKIFKNISNGKFDDNKLNNAKNTIMAAIDSSTDTPAGIINDAYAKVLVDGKTNEEKIENIKKITREDIIKVTKKININRVFILEATDGEN